MVEENRYGIEQAILRFDGNDEAHVEQIIPSGVLGLTVGLDGVFRENVVQVPPLERSGLLRRGSGPMTIRSS